MKPIKPEKPAINPVVRPEVVYVKPVFPAKPINSAVSIASLSLAPEIRAQLARVSGAVKIATAPPAAMLLTGTGAARAAEAVAGDAGRHLCRINVSAVVSKYTGETEKNLNRTFAEAESKGWVLFLDEADALLGQRTEVKDAHDRYANQAISYLLQRIEGYRGLVIVATNRESGTSQGSKMIFRYVVRLPSRSWP